MSDTKDQTNPFCNQLIKYDPVFVEDYLCKHKCCFESNDGYVHSTWIWLLFLALHTQIQQNISSSERQKYEPAKIDFVFQSKILIIIKQSYYDGITRLHPLFIFMCDLNMLIRNLFIVFFNEHSYPNITFNCPNKALWWWCNMCWNNHTQ